MDGVLGWGGFLGGARRGRVEVAVCAARAGEALGEVSQEEPQGALVRRARGGDRAAFGALVEILQEPLYFAVLRLVRDAQDARDVVQRSFLRAWTHLGTLEEEGRFRGWLFSIALNLARNHVRDQGRRRHEPLEEGALEARGQSASAQVERREERGRLRAALEALPARQREVVTLRIDAELSFREIGEAVGCTEATARVNFHHGVKRLRELMGEEGA